jgi:hypothetical protein
LRTADGTPVYTCHYSASTSPALSHLAVVVLVLLSSVWLSIPSASAQTQQSDESPSTVHGTVINAVTHAPLSRALVYSPDNRFAMLTDGDGHFEFALPKEGLGNTGTTFEGQPRAVWSVAGAGGPFWLMARKPGFLDDPNDNRQVQTSGSGDVTIPLMPEAVIKGRVVVSATDPASEIPVQLLSRQITEGVPRWVHANTVLADSNGEFRFAELTPGIYKVGTSELMDNDPAVTVPGGQAYGFPPVYYPGVSDFASAGTIELTAGQTVQADLPVTRQPYYPVRIPLANADASAGMNVTVSLQAHRGPGFTLGFNGEKHRIEGLLPNGNYLVEVASYGQNASSGSVNIAVAGARVEGPPLNFHPGSSITLHVDEQFTSKGGDASGNWMVGGRSFQMRGPRVYLQVRVESEDSLEGQGGASLRPPSGPNDDALVIENLAPGRYRLRLYTTRGYVASATMGGIDLLHEPLVVAPGSTTPIEIKMRDDTAEMDGTVTGLTADSGAAASSSAYIYCVPLHDSPGQMRQAATSGPDGKFTLDAMAPGAYRVFAFKSPQPNLPYGDAEAMQPYETKGQVVQLSAGQKANVQVQLSSSSE